MAQISKMRQNTGEKHKQMKRGMTMPELARLGLQRDYNDVANTYARESRQISFNLSKLIREVKLIE